MPETKALSETQKALVKMGLGRDIDLALHLPLRYEDETRIVKLRDCREGDTAQIEATVTESHVAFRPRRQLVVTVDDGTRSEERRVGKECRSRWSRYHYRKKGGESIVQVF